MNFCTAMGLFGSLVAAEPAEEHPNTVPAEGMQVAVAPISNSSFLTMLKNMGGNEALDDMPDAIHQMKAYGNCDSEVTTTLPLDVREGYLWLRGELQKHMAEREDIRFNEGAAESQNRHRMQGIQYSYRAYKCFCGYFEWLLKLPPESKNNLLARRADRLQDAAAAMGSCAERALWKPEYKFPKPKKELLEDPLEPAAEYGKLSVEWLDNRIDSDRLLVFYYLKRV